MKKIVIGVIVIVVVAFLLLNLFGEIFTGHSKEERIPIFYLNQDKCSRCGMLISDIRFAAALLVADETEFRKYDDIGCMLADYDELTNKNLEIVSVIVYDYNSARWVKAEDAWFVLAKNRIHTPMGYGVVAFAKYEDAIKFANEYGGYVMGWKDLVKSIGEVVYGGG